MSRATGYKWVRRYRTEGSRASPTAAPARTGRPPDIGGRGRADPRGTGRAALGSRPAGTAAGHPVSTVAAVLRRGRAPRLADIDRPTGVPVRRYEACHPGALVHQDHKKLGRIPDGGGHRVLGRADRDARGKAGLGYDHFEVIVDDRSRRAVVVQVADESAASAAAALETASRRSPPTGSGRAGPDRQRLGLPLERLSGRPRRPPPQPDPALSPADQRQGRAVHRDAGPRVGLRAAVHARTGSAWRRCPPSSTSTISAARIPRSADSHPRPLSTTSVQITTRASPAGGRRTSARRRRPGRRHRRRGAARRTSPRHRRAAPREVAAHGPHQPPGGREPEPCPAPEGRRGRRAVEGFEQRAPAPWDRSPARDRGPRSRATWGPAAERRARPASRRRRSGPRSGAGCPGPARGPRRRRGPAAGRRAPRRGRAARGRRGPRPRYAR